MHFALQGNRNRLPLLATAITIFCHANQTFAETFPVGTTQSFTLDLTRAETGSEPQIVIHHQNRRLLTSLPNEPLITGGLQQLDASEKRGSFTLHENIAALCHQQGELAVQANSTVVILQGQISGDERCESRFTMRFDEVLPGHLRFQLRFENAAVNYSQLTYQSSPDERFYGFGEQFSVLDMKGRSVPILSQEGGVGRGQAPITGLVNVGSPGSGGKPLSTYYAVPHYITNTLTSVFLENSDVSVFDLTAADRVNIRIFSGAVDGRVLAGNSMLDLIERYTEYSGRMRPLPDWFNEGAIVGMQGGTAAVHNVLDELTARGTPVAGVWLQDWVGKRKTLAGSQLWWNWELDQDRYPNWHGLVDRIEANGGKVMCYINPFLVDATPKGNVRRNLYQEAVAQGFLVKRPDGSVYGITNTDFDAGMIDLTHPDAVVWIKAVIKDQLIDEGRCHGWMHDFAEGLPFDARLHNGQTGAQYHNQYTVDWVRVAREAIDESGHGDSIVFFNRSGAAKTPGYSTLLWQGDQLVTWDRFDGFRSAILATLTGGFSGISLNHADIGGYTNAGIGKIGFNREQELLLRWMEFAAFTAAYRTHEGLKPELNAQFYSNATTYAHFDKFARVYKALAFYRKQLFEEAQHKGYPVVRHPLLHYPQDKTLATLKDQIMLGSEILMAPIVNKRAFNNDWNKVYFPDADNTTWVHVFTGEKFTGKKYGHAGNTSAPWWLQLVNPARGNWRWVHSPLGQPAAFYREGSAIAPTLEENLKTLGVK